MSGVKAVLYDWYCTNDECRNMWPDQGHANPPPCSACGSEMEAEPTFGNDYDLGGEG